MKFGKGRTFKEHYVRAKLPWLGDLNPTHHLSHRTLSKLLKIIKGLYLEYLAHFLTEGKLTALNSNEGGHTRF